MSNERKTLPGVLLLMLSALGFLFGLGVALLTLAGSRVAGLDAMDFPQAFPKYSVGLLAVAVALLNIPAFILSIRYLRAKPVAVRQRSLFKPASLSLVLWVIALAGGFWATRPPGAALIAALMTVLAVVIPIWWLVEFSRRGLPRVNAAREWGTLAVGLSVAPLIIMAAEIFLLLVVGVGVFFALSAQPGFTQQMAEALQNIEMNQGSLEELEKLLFGLAQNPLIAAAILATLGFLAPFIEEFFKPMAIWFLLKRPLKDHEGFSLGLISGGAFALLESAGLMAQMSAETWLTAVALRAATGLLHVGLSGLAGYGLARAWNQKHFARALLYLAAAGLLHGAWNFLALLNGFSSISMPAPTVGAAFSAGMILTLAGMVAVFATTLFIVLRINRSLRGQLAESGPQQPADAI